MHWAAILLHNLNKLEIYEEAIRKVAAKQRTTEALDTPLRPDAHTRHQFSTTNEDRPGTISQQGRGGGNIAKPRPNKTIDPEKELRQQYHAQHMEEAVVKRRAEGAAREAARLAAIPEDHTIIQPAGLINQQTLPEHPNPSVLNHDDIERIYD